MKASPAVPAKRPRKPRVRRFYVVPLVELRHLCDGYQVVTGTATAAAKAHRDFMERGDHVKPIAAETVLIEVLGVLSSAITVTVTPCAWNGEVAS